MTQAICFARVLYPSLLGDVIRQPMAGLIWRHDVMTSYISFGPWTLPLEFLKGKLGMLILLYIHPSTENSTALSFHVTNVITLTQCRVCVCVCVCVCVFLAFSMSYIPSIRLHSHHCTCYSRNADIHVGPIGQKHLYQGTEDNCPSEVLQYRPCLYRPTLHNGLVQGLYMHSFRPHHCASDSRTVDKYAGPVGRASTKGTELHCPLRFTRRYL